MNALGQAKGAGKGYKKPVWARPVPVLIAVAGFSALVLRIAAFEPLVWWRTHEQFVAEAHQPLARPPALPISIVEPTPQGTDSSVSPVPLRLHLKGTRLGRNPSEGYAEIGVDVRSPQTYRAGAILANGARLTQVHADRVELMRDGHAATLYVEGTRYAEAAAKNDPVLSAGSIVAVGGGAAPAVARADSRDALTEDIRVSPVFEGTRVAALQVYPAAGSPVFKQLGLQPGDRITQIDGVSVNDTEASVAALRRLTDGQALVVTVRRGGRNLTLSLDGAVMRGVHSGT